MRGARRVSHTIHALASGTLPAGVAVIRVSGSLVPSLVTDWIGRPLAPRTAALVMLRDENGGVLDEALALHFPAPRSFTGEDVLELHCHGGPAVVRAVERRLAELGSRVAEPGEFTMRAHANGRIDLMEAERLGDLIAAETEAERALATSDAGRRNAALYEGWRLALLEARALLEASIDFADEEDAPLDVSAEVATTLDATRAAIAEHLARAPVATIVRHGLRVVLAGAPNAGKSSLLNALAGSQAAIVTDVPGTTRDALDVPLDVGGRKVIVTDVAGLRETDDAVERIGVERARERIAGADLVLHCVPGDALADAPSAVPSLGVRPMAERARVVRLLTKADLATEGRAATAEIGIGGGDGRSGTPPQISVSARTGEGMDDLLALLAARAAEATAPATEAPLTERHAGHLARALDHLDLAALPPEIVTERVRLAAGEIGRITGATNIEDVYGTIFSRFCMGK